MEVNQVNIAGENHKQVTENTSFLHESAQQTHVQGYNNDTFSES